MAPFQLTLDPPQPGRPPVLKVRGDLDLYTSRDFNEKLAALADTVPGDLVVDLLGSSFVDSTASRALLHASRVLRANGARLVVVCRDPEVLRILTVMGLEEFLEIVPSPDAAVHPAGV